MLDRMIQAAGDLTHGVDEHVNKDALQSIYQLKWHSPNTERRDVFRREMKEPAGEQHGDQAALKYLCQIAQKIDIEIMCFPEVTPHSPQESGGEPWRTTDEKKKKAAKAKKKKEEEEEATRKDKERTKSGGGGGGGGTGGPGGKVGGGRKGGGGGTEGGKGAVEQEPPWEQGWLEKLEWDTPFLNEEGVVQDG